MREPKLGTRMACLVTEVVKYSSPSDMYPRGHTAIMTQPDLPGRSCAFDFYAGDYEPASILIFEFRLDPFHPDAADWQPVIEVSNEET
jgi:hypothetical protein